MLIKSTIAKLLLILKTLSGSALVDVEKTTRRNVGTLLPTCLLECPDLNVYPFHSDGDLSFAAVVVANYHQTLTIVDCRHKSMPNSEVEDRSRVERPQQFLRWPLSMPCERSIRISKNCTPRSKRSRGMLGFMSTQVNYNWPCEVSSLRIRLPELQVNEFRRMGSVEFMLTHITVLGLNGQSEVRRLARVLLADPLAKEQPWERQLLEYGETDGRAILLR